MNRAHPVFSRAGCLGGVVLVLGVLAGIAVSGGALFSPGELTAFADDVVPAQPVASHAEIGNDCRQCHAPFTGISAQRCLACHDRVAQQRASGGGLHGALAAPQAARCDDCHTDHQGRAFDPSTDALLRLDHASLGFSLARHVEDFQGQPLACQGCHQQPDFQFEPVACAVCHLQADPGFAANHVSAFGTNCLACHDGMDATGGFDHGQTGFPLDDHHAALTCAACHRPEVPPSETPSQCAACHAEPPAHAGVFAGQDCADCHAPTGWTPARAGNVTAFRHADTTFKLVNHTVDFAGAPLTCAVCHTAASTHDFSVSGQACVTCHTVADPAFMEPHRRAFGDSCLSCHDGAGNMANFDHAQTGFVLEGAHAAVECAACHVSETSAGAPRECAGCHQEPPLHAGLFGTDCAACHTPTAWLPAQMPNHSFPLNHGSEGLIACATCHIETFAAYTCTNCHEHEPNDLREEHADEGIVGDRLLDCAACHPHGEKD